jgi:starvation-inducible outer membrane lipoprotein
MKNALVSASWLLLAAPLLTGCVSIPPLIQVQHTEKQPPPQIQSGDISSRLDAIDRRLDSMEKNLERK